MGKTLKSLFPPLLTALILTACGGGSDSGSSNYTSTSRSNATLLAQEPDAPAVTGDTATDGFNWFNLRRQQMGIPLVTRNSKLDTAAQAHSNYQSLNDVITHEETPGKPGFYGASEGDRLVAAGYALPSNDYAYGEVISSTSNPSGFSAAEDLIVAIYHRFVIFDPSFKEAGAGSDVSSTGLTYFTTDFAAIGLNAGIGPGGIVTYPFAGQQHVPVDFFSDNELPDPVPSQNEVGYPISVHADITNSVTVQSFTIAPRGGAALAVRLLDYADDANMRAFNTDSAAAIIPLAPLAASTTYDVQFVGTVGGTPVTRSWSFTTE